MHLQVLKAFVGLHEFSDLNLVQALRCVSQNNFCTQATVKVSMKSCSSFSLSSCSCDEIFLLTGMCLSLCLCVCFFYTSAVLQAVSVELSSPGRSSED